jgi:hypothetical protein
LVEGPSRRSATELMGRTECNRIVNFDGGPLQSRLVGRLLRGLLIARGLLSWLVPKLPRLLPLPLELRLA